MTQPIWKAKVMLIARKNSGKLTLEEIVARLPSNLRFEAAQQIKTLVGTSFLEIDGKVFVPGAPGTVRAIARTQASA